jgi:hypothetical protein
MEGSGVCYDKGATDCNDAAVIRCRSSRSCPIGTACVKTICDCGDATTGVCIGTAGCGDEGTAVMGGLVRIGETEKRRRNMRGLGHTL